MKIIKVLVGDTLEDDITPTSPEEYYLEGIRVKISCNYTVIADILLWYRQYSGSGLQFLYIVTTNNNPYKYKQSPGSAPQYLLLIQHYTGTEHRAVDSLDSRFSGKLNKEKTRVDLEISSVEETNSAMYYCALRPTIKGGSHGNDITPTSDKVFGLEGDVIKLSCNYSSASTLQWYHQYPGSSPIFLLLTTVSSNPSVVNATPPYQRQSVVLNERTLVDLEVSSDEVLDSTLYYCALEPRVKGNPDTQYKTLN
ncbi:uncharacterized protein LOC109875445 [Oncorhynchus kisutch]|uniref:uncharacterized protein LOC109875445 n=1 Tax=Oncorhynchus kisutch TaxID=8019 RepID=UPI0009A085F9|nr:uncharacterized protein LOC109875445 [Oncorhynchus kisutch]